MHSTEYTPVHDCAEIAWRVYRVQMLFKKNTNPSHESTKTKQNNNKSNHRNPAEPNQTRPNQTEPHHTKQNPSKPNQTMLKLKLTPNPPLPLPPTDHQVQLVTNVFRKTSSGWRLARHHASDRDVATPKGSSGGPNVSAVMGGGGGGGGKQSRDGQSGNSLLSHFVDENGKVTELSARMFRVSDGEIT